MAGEIQVSYQSGRTVYAVIRNRIGQVYNTSTILFENFSDANWASYVNSLTEQGTSGYYSGTFPTVIAAGVYSLLAKNQTGGSPAETDVTIAVGDYQWNGVATFPLSDLATSGQLGTFSPLRVARGNQVLNFPFKLVSSVDHVTPFTSGVVSGQISRDGGSFGALQSGAFVELGLGWYRTTLTSGDLLANTVAISFSAVGISGGSADQRDFAMITQRVSGSV